MFVTPNGNKFKIPEANSKIAGMYSPFFHLAIPKPKLNKEPITGINLPNFNNLPPIPSANPANTLPNLPPFIASKKPLANLPIGFKSLGKVLATNSPTGPIKSAIQAANAVIPAPKASNKGNFNLGGLSSLAFSIELFTFPTVVLPPRAVSPFSSGVICFSILKNSLANTVVTFVILVLS